MKKMDSDTLNDFDCFIFTHIPKCGGTSFRRLVNDAAQNSGIDKNEIYIPGLNDLANDKNIDQLNDEAKEEFIGSSYKVIAAHSKFNLHKEYELNIQNPFYYTILRDPVKRFISHYHFFYYTLGYNKLKGVELNDLSDDKLIFLIKKLSNIQTDYLANFQFKKVIGEENLLKLAKYNLQYEYSSFGIIEDIDSSINVLKKEAPNWMEIKGSLPVLNSSNSNKVEISEKVNKLIIENNKCDIELYRFAKRISNNKL